MRWLTGDGPVLSPGLCLQGFALHADRVDMRHGEERARPAGLIIERAGDELQGLTVALVENDAPAA